MIVLGLFYIGIAPEFSGYHFRESVTDENGNQYHFVYAGFLRPDRILARNLGSTFLADRYQILVQTDPDYSNAHIPVIRPDGAQNNHGQLYLTNDQWLIGISSGNNMPMAFDLKHQKAYYYEEIAGLSPFILINEDTTLNPKDIEIVLDHPMGSGKSNAEDVTYYFKSAAIRSALDHPNPEVRKIARKILANNPE